MRHIVTCLALTAIAIMAPRYALAGDVEIAQQIAAQLRGQKDAQQLRGFHIGVKVENGKVWMKGQVSDAKQQALALDIARRIPGVTMVVNELHVAAPKPTAASATVVSPAAATTATPVAHTPPPLASPAFQPATAATLRQPASTQVTATMPALAPANAVNPSAVAIRPPAPVVQPMLGQPMVMAQAQVPPPAAPATPTYSTSAPVAMSAPEVTGSGLARAAVTRSSVPSLHASPPMVTTTLRQSSTQAGPAPAAIQTAVANTPQAPMSAPRPIARMAANAQPAAPADIMVQPAAMPVARHGASVGGGVPGVVYDHPSTPSYAWPSYAAYPNYAGVTYPQQYSPTAWPYIGPFYPYPQVPLGWRKVTLEWDDGWWFLDFKSK